MLSVLLLAAGAQLDPAAGPKPGQPDPYQGYGNPEPADLSALPDARLDWPEMSVTFFSLSDVEPSAGKSPDPGGLDLAELAGSIGKVVHVVGLFGGHNLLGDLPAGSELAPSDWVLRRGRDAVWVTGRPPRGHGWSLDPSYAGDSAHWLEVTGRVEKRGEITPRRSP